EEAKDIAAHANATAEGVIGEANTRAAQLMAQAQANAELMVNQLRAEAAAIVSKAVGDLTALEANTVDELASVHPPSAWSFANDEAKANGASSELASPLTQGEQDQSAAAEDFGLGGAHSEAPRTPGG